jgi:hypothetical protein
MAVPAGAKGHKSSPCTRIRQELKAGKSAEDVAKDLKVSSATVKSCTQAKSSDANTAKK